MAEFLTWDMATWQRWATDKWALLALAAAGVLLLAALAVRASRAAYGSREGEFVSAMPDHPISPGREPGQLLPDRRADILAAIDADYATGRIDRVEWERRRREL